jgi:hypothetical protein
MKKNKQMKSYHYSLCCTAKVQKHLYYLLKIIDELTQNSAIQYFILALILEKPLMWHTATGIRRQKV